MKMLVCLHGNPLQGQEFESLMGPLSAKGYNPLVHKRPIKGSQLEPLLQSISATAKVSGTGPFGLIAYSWGAYLALAYAKRFPENVTRLILINPMIVDHHPLSSTMRFVYATPLLRSLVLKIRGRALARNYVRRTFAPAEPSVEIKGSLEPFLSQSLVWKGAANYKKLMLSTPLVDHLQEVNTPVRVVFGEKDEVAPMREQLTLLEKLPALQKIVVPGGGHALPWTHSQFILDQIEKTFESP